MHALPAVGMTGHWLYRDLRLSSFQRVFHMRAYAGFAFILLAAVLWGLIGPVARFSMQTGVDALELAFWRASIGGCFFLLHAALTRGLSVRGPRDVLAFALFGSFSLGGFFASNQYSIQTGGAALAAVLLYTAPAWVAVFSRIFFGDRLTTAKSAAILLALAGVAVISFSTTPEAMPASVSPMAGVIFGLLAGLLYSTHYIFSKKYLSVYTAYTLYGYCTIFGALALYPFVSFADKGIADWGVLLFLGLVSTYGAYLAYCAGLRRLDPTKASVLATMEPVVATAAAWWLWGEMFTALGWAGAGLILCPVFILVFDRGGKPPRMRE